MIVDRCFYALFIALGLCSLLGAGWWLYDEVRNGPSERRECAEWRDEQVIDLPMNFHVGHGLSLPLGNAEVRTERRCVRSYWVKLR